MGSSVNLSTTYPQLIHKEGRRGGHSHANPLAAEELFIQLRIAGKGEVVDEISKKFGVSTQAVKDWRVKFKWEETLSRLQKDERNKFIAKISEDRANGKFEEYLDNKKIQADLKGAAKDVLAKLVEVFKKNVMEIKTVSDFKILAEMLHTLTGKPSQITETHNGDIVEQEVRHSKEVRDILEKVILHKSN